MSDTILERTRMLLAEAGYDPNDARVDMDGVVYIIAHRVPAEVAWRAGHLLAMSGLFGDEAICFACYEPAYVNCLHRDLMDEAERRCRSTTHGELDCGLPR